MKKQQIAQEFFVSPADEALLKKRGITGQIKPERNGYRIRFFDRNYQLMRDETEAPIDFFDTMPAAQHRFDRILNRIRHRS